MYKREQHTKFADKDYRKLLPYQLTYAKHVAWDRQQGAILKGLIDKIVGIGNKGYKVHLNGATGELIFATALGFPKYQLTVDTFRDGPADVLGYQVKTLPTNEVPHLWIDNNVDHDREEPYVLVQRYFNEGGAPVGWLMSTDLLAAPVSTRHDSMGHPKTYRNVDFEQLKPMGKLPRTKEYLQALSPVAV